MKFATIITFIATSGIAHAGQRPIASVIDIGCINASSTRTTIDNISDLNIIGFAASRYWPIGFENDGFAKHFVGFGVTSDYVIDKTILGAVGKYSYVGGIGIEAGPITSIDEVGGTARMWFGLGHIGFQLGANYLINSGAYYGSIGIYGAFPIHIVVKNKHEFFPFHIPLGDFDG